VTQLPVALRQVATLEERDQRLIARSKIVFQVGKPAPAGPTAHAGFVGLGKAHVIYTMGVDSVQALVLCLAAVSCQMAVWGKSGTPLRVWGRKRGSLTWLGSTDVGLHLHEYPAAYEWHDGR